ncbi:MAG TPA: type III pantothenate kinase, partial [Saprospiraceae bacterium]|nr:type III pantothenate kinase [Saprospiraceae bacterium]
MLLAIDAGNTDIVFGLYDGKEWLQIWRIPSKQNPSIELWQYRLVNELLELGLNAAVLKQGVISSVVPTLIEPLRQMLKMDLGVEPVVVGQDIYSKLDITINNPLEIGTDLVANAVAAYDRFQQSCVIVDFGTALTFTSVSNTKELCGVAIAPGLKTAVQSLFQKTAQLPEVPLIVPQSALGKDTIHAIQAGVLLGYTGMVEYILAHIKKELSTDCKVIATGGLSSILTSLEGTFDYVDKLLTLNGLLLIA